MIPAFGCFVPPFEQRFVPPFFQVLVDLNADPNRANKFGMTPLHHASVAGDADILRQLMDAGARPNAADDQGGRSSSGEFILQKKGNN